MRKLPSTILVIILLLGLNLLILGLILPSKEFSVENPEAGLVFSLLANQEPEQPAITLYAVGDIMLDRGVEYKINKEGDSDFQFPFLKIAEELNKADILFGNLEGPISDKGMRVGSIYSFRIKPEAVQALVYAGFDILSLANNHMLDYQRIALEDTMSILKQNSIDYIGAGFDATDANSVKVREVGDTKIGFLAYTNLGPKVWRASKGSPGLAWIDENDFAMIETDIKNIKRTVDVLVVSLHAGTEYSSEPTLFQTSFARACIDAGADLVIGHHPHVVQPIEQYQDGWIAYSLGNFVFDQSFSEQTMQGLLLKVSIKDSKIKEVVPQNIKLNEYFQPEILQK